jgi:alpha-amylase/alpha-mannosidase (GH57 family)
MLATAFAILEACGQKLQESQVPAAARTAFEKKYPHVKGTWDREGNNYEVNFKQANTDMSAVIDKGGTIVETETDILITDLPRAIQDYVKQHYQGTKIAEAARIVKANGEINYEAEVNHKDVLFDVNGKFIKESKD